ncbi:Ig-like domain-containing protein, partial [Serratia fonticola]
TSDKAGSVKVEAEVGGVTSSTDLSFVADNATAKIDENGLTAEPGNTVANGTDVNLVQLPVKDAQGNPIPGFEVTFTVTEPDGSTRQQTVTFNQQATWSQTDDGESRFTLAGKLDNHDGAIEAQRLALTAGQLGNQGGRLVALDNAAQHWRVGGLFDNVGGTVGSNGDLRLDAGHLDNQG